MTTGILTPLQLIAGASLLQNQGLGVSTELTAAIAAYSNTPLMQAYLAAEALDPSIATLAANTVPAFSNSVPAAYSGLGTQMTTVISTQASLDAGSGDVSKFVQAFNLASSYGRLTNQFINSAVNSQTYLGNTFTSTNDMITGDITTVNLATSTFGQDLLKLGNLIDLSNLNNLGSPLALVQQIGAVAGNVPVLAIYFIAAGVPQEIVVNLTDPTLSVTDSVQKIMYEAMTQITGTDLDQILQVLKVTTPGITTAADLLNPAKLFPNSYLSLTVVTANGPRAVYINSAESVNTNLLAELPDYVVVSYNRLQQIIPPGPALANKALGIALAQINGISNTSLPSFSNTVTAMETTKDLPLITALTTAVPPAVANYYTSTLANGNGPNGTIRIVDIIGLAGGWVAADAFARTVAIFATMDLTDLTEIYQTMVGVLDGTYDSGSDPDGYTIITIPFGLPGAGTYNPITAPNPTPPPANIEVTSAASQAMAVLIGDAQAEIANLQTQYPNECNELNSLWTGMAEQVTKEQTLQPLVNLNFANLQANNRNSIYSFILGLPSYGSQTQEGGIAWFLEAMADLSNLGGEAVIGCLREGRNLTALSSAGIYTSTKIPADPNPPPPNADLLPSVYTETEAQNLVVK